MKYLPLVLILLFLNACKKSNDVTFLKAKVLMVQCCDRTAIVFEESQLTVKEATGSEALVYTVLNVPSIFRKNGTEFYIKVRPATADEFHVCTEYCILPIAIDPPPYSILVSVAAKSL